MYRLLIDKGNLGKKYSLFTLNLAVSDMLMGIYLLIIGVVDIYYDGKYAWHDHKWRNSSLCTAAGILSSVSSEMSTFLILMVTIDRLIVIMFPLSRLSQGNVTWKWSVFVSVLLWMVSGTLAIIPVIALQSYFKDEFYSQSSVCLALPLRGNEQPGTEYSFAVFVCLNSFIFLLVLVGQMCICKSLRTSGARISSSQKRRREMTVAWTLFFVVATDFCCWFPIGVMGVASRFGMDIPDTVYAWVMVFVLPINAAINPLLYTGTAIWRNRKKKSLPIIPLTPQQNQRTGDSTTLASVIRQRSSNDK
ncbi:G-protein coupled receptor GRL101-like [Argopecten irradians]|uniref:G-protein coupled receptor GRL101-like n=1 Tax=Argopecten irradians TaxID=31199 RepID=UPI003718FFD9